MPARLAQRMAGEEEVGALNDALLYRLRKPPVCPTCIPYTAELKICHAASCASHRDQTGVTNSAALHHDQLGRAQPSKAHRRSQDIGHWTSNSKHDMVKRQPWKAPLLAHLTGVSDGGETPQKHSLQNLGCPSRHEAFWQGQQPWQIGGASSAVDMGVAETWHHIQACAVHHQALYHLVFWAGL